MARTATISPNPALRVWRGRCVRRSRLILAPRAKCRQPRVSSAADFGFIGGEGRCRFTQFMLPRATTRTSARPTALPSFAMAFMSGPRFWAWYGSPGIGYGWRWLGGSFLWAPPAFELG